MVFAEDVTPLGSYYYRRSNLHPSLLLPFSKENIDILRQHKEIKGIIFGIYAMNKYKLVLMYNNEETNKDLINAETREEENYTNEYEKAVLQRDKDDKYIDVVNEMYDDNVLDDDDIEELNLSKEKDDFER